MMLSECSAIRRRRSEEDGDNRRAKIPPINRRADKFFRPQIIAAEIFSPENQDVSNRRLGGVLRGERQLYKIIQCNFNRLEKYWEVTPSASTCQDGIY